MDKKIFPTPPPPKGKGEFFIFYGDTVVEECEIYGNGFICLYLFFMFYEGENYRCVGRITKGIYMTWPWYEQVFKDLQW